MSLGSIQKIGDKELFIETSGSYTYIALALEVVNGDVKKYVELTEWELEKIFSRDEVREIKRSDDYHKTIAELYYSNNPHYVDRVAKENRS